MSFSAILGVITAAVVVSAAVFLLNIERSHVRSFYLPRTYRQQLRDDFADYTETGVITVLMARDRIYWPKAAVREFLAERWEQWELDPPDWFADWRWKAALPAECWPNEEMRLTFEDTLARSLDG